MDDLMSIDSASNFSSMAEPPSHLERQYSPLVPVFHDHGATLPDRRSPESNSEAMIHALKALQDKIRGLELERATAAKKFQLLTEETDRHTRSTQTPLPTTTSTHSSPPPYASPFGRDTEDLRARLDSIDTKLASQARSLEGLRHGMTQAETDRHRLLSRYEEQRQRGAERERSRTEFDEVHPVTGLQSPHVSPTTEAKLRRLETEHSRLASGHSQTRAKLKDLEHRLQTEQWRRGQPQDRTVLGYDDGDRRPSKSRGGHPRSSSKKRKKTVPHRSYQCTCGRGTRGEEGGGQEPVCTCRPVPGVHYRLNLKDVPFIIGTSTAPSHSVPANYQQLLAAMKAHNPLLCGAAAACQGYGGRGRRRHKPSVSQGELRSLLAGLEEEFGRLTFEHQEVARQLQVSGAPSTPHSATADLEKQFENLVETMETKSEQIRIVQKQLDACKTRTKFRPPRQAPPTSSLAADEGTGMRDSAVPRSPSLDFLQRVRTLQSTLQRDNLSWD